MAMPASGVTSIGIIREYSSLDVGDMNETSAHGTTTDSSAHGRASIVAKVRTAERQPYQQCARQSVNRGNSAHGRAPTVATVRTAERLPWHKCSWQSVYCDNRAHGTVSVVAPMYEAPVGVTVLRKYSHSRHREHH